MKPVSAKEILQKDPYQRVEVLRRTENPEQLIWMAARNDYSEKPITDRVIPFESEAGAEVVDLLLEGERGHWGVAEHPQISFGCFGFTHDVITQARTHRVGVTFDVQSGRYTGKRYLKVASGELKPEEVFYVRPAGYYLDRKGHRYEWSEEERQREFDKIVESCKDYAFYYQKGYAEEHIRGYIPYCFRQNFVVSFNLRSSLHFLDLRSKFDAQLEIQALCEGILPHLKSWAPNILGYYEQKRLYKARLAP